MVMKTVFMRSALAEIPKLLTLLDRNPHSPTYGCFDRNYWHYKIIDFPSGMSQEFVWPLALAFDTAADSNPYYQKPVIRDWVHAGMTFAAQRAHKDGSCDDYYPFEKASGAAAFSLLAFAESYRILGFDDSRLLLFFQNRTDWLADHLESGQLSNHQALITLCLELMGRLLQTDRWNRQKRSRLKCVLAWQNQEGWFQEYEGFDPGYHTLTILLLAWLHQLNPEDQRLNHALSIAVDLCLDFIHPDGTFGGEYGSRNTNNYFASGFEMVSRWKPEALFLNEQYARALDQHRTPCYSDDHIIGHHLWDYFLTYRSFNPSREFSHTRKGRVYLRQGKLLVDRRDETELYLALNKGGVFKLFKKKQVVCADTGISLLVKKGSKTKNAVAHLVDDYDIDVADDCITIQGQLGWAKQQQMDSLKMIILRLVMYGFGRFFPNLIRKLLQGLLITGKKRSGIRFQRQLTWQGDAWLCEDRIEKKQWDDVEHICIGCDQTSIYVVMSRTYHPGQLFQVVDVTSEIKKLRPGQDLIIRRTLS